MKVLVVHNAYQSHHLGGEDVVVAREIAGLKAHLGEQNVFSYLVSNDDIKPLQLALKIWGDKTHANNIEKIILEHKIDIVHVHNFFPKLTPLVFARAKQLGTKVIHTLHNFRWWCLSGILYREEIGTCEACVGKRVGVPAVLNRCYRNSFTQSLAGSMAFAWYQLQDYAKNIDAYFALSQFQHEKVKPLLNGSTLFIKPNPIDEPEVFLDPVKRKDFLFVGRLEAAKGIELLLNTWLQLPNTFHLNVIGASDDPALIQKYTRPNISFLGKRPHEEVLQHMARAKYVLHTSLTYETFGLTMVEALARGTPVIGLNIGTRPEFITHGKNGFLCTPSELKQTLITANDYTHYDTLSANAIQSVKPFYAQTVIAKQVALYQQMLTSDRVR